MDQEYQEQLYKQGQKRTQKTKNLLGMRSAKSHVLSSPYTVMIKPYYNYYLFFAYSMGRPRNVVWGEVVPEGTRNVRVKFGCKWNSMKVISDALEKREAKGFVLVSTIAKDQITMRFLGDMIYNAYLKGFHVQYGKYKLSNEEVREFVNERMMYENDDKLSIVLKVSRELAFDILEDKNFSEIKPKGRLIPQYVIRGVHDFLEHNPTLAAGDLPKECPQYEDCRVKRKKVCEIYGDEEDEDIL
jgi:hypothetical protein